MRLVCRATVASPIPKIQCPTNLRKSTCRHYKIAPAVLLSAKTRWRRRTAPRWMVSKRSGKVLKTFWKSWISSAVVVIAAFQPRTIRLVMTACTRKNWRGLALVSFMVKIARCAVRIVQVQDRIKTTWIFNRIAS